MSKRYIQFQQNNAKIQTFGGPKRKNSEQCFFYGGPEKQRRVFTNPNEIPTFESLTKTRMIDERRFYLNNSNSKFICMGIVPATKLLAADAPGFYFEAMLCGEKSSPLPVGGIQGMAALFAAIRDIPIFSRVNASKHGIEGSENIEISTGFEFAKNVYKITNTKIENKSIFLAEQGLYALLKNEEHLMGVGRGYDSIAVEKEFEQMVSAGVDDFHTFNANMLNNPTRLSGDILLNFEDFFEFVLDVKKSEKESSGILAANAVVASISERQLDVEVSTPHAQQQQQVPAIVQQSTTTTPKRNQKKN